ncbi:MAG TPA: hypothetical protein VF547_09310 [Allosphingosinicella sp.]|jgi:hypothetical protein
MRPFAAAAAALLVLQAPPLAARAAKAPASEATIDRFLAVLPDRGEIDSPSAEVDPAELGALAALNPGKEAQVRSVLEGNLACSNEAISAGTRRMLRTVAGDLGEAKVKRLADFYAGPDYAAFEALGARMNAAATPSAEDQAAMAGLMEAYPLQAWLEGLNRAQEIIAADEGFLTEAMKCAELQMNALEAAGLKSH